ncbi:unnamed protein product [Cuscuta europaea]|uniref:Uncharacterized protein n=1 Tax=Cuscuta europaea TaxID=41803 RepID=A0A9P1E863_CUSEU|nr:unnamed protein product [Cuscuta europaea]
MFPPTAIFRSLIVLILATGAFSLPCGNNAPLASSDDLNTTSYGETGLHNYQCVGNFGPCDGTCDEACCYRICRSSYSGLNPCPVCRGSPIRFCLCYHDCY